MSCPCLVSAANRPACALAASVLKLKTGNLANTDSTKAERRAFLASLSAQCTPTNNSETVTALIYTFPYFSHFEKSIALKELEPP